LKAERNIGAPTVAYWNRRVASMAMSESSDIPSHETQLEMGRALAGKLFKGAPRNRRLPRDMNRHTMAHVFGDLWQGPDLTVEQRSMITCTVLTALGKEAELRLHLRGARNLGIERSALEAMMLHVSHYAGWPTGVSAARLLDEIWETMDAEEATEG